MLALDLKKLVVCSVVVMSGVAVANTASKVYSTYPASVTNNSVTKNKYIPKQNNQLDIDARHWFLGADFGIASLDLKNQTTINNGSDFESPYNVDIFTIKQNSPVMAALQTGYRWDLDKKWLSSESVSLRYQYFLNKNITGTITQYSLPEFENYNYKTNLNINALSLYSKTDLIRYKNFLPYVDAGLGLALNRTNNYQETALPNVTERVSPAFKSNSNLQFAYNIGVGVDFEINKATVLSIGYDYQSFGNAKTSKGQSTWSEDSLNFGHLNANTAVVGISYFIY